MPSAMAGSQADESATRVGIEMRSAFAHEIGGPEYAITTRWGGGGFVGENLIGIASILYLGSKIVSEPAQGESGRLGYAHHVPTAGNSMTEGVEASLGIHGGL